MNTNERKKDQSLFQTVRFSEQQQTYHHLVFIITLRDAPGDYNDSDSGMIFQTQAQFLGAQFFRSYYSLEHFHILNFRFITMFIKARLWDHMKPVYALLP